MDDDTGRDSGVGAGGADAPSTSAGAHDQEQQQRQYGGGEYGDDFDDAAAPTNDFELLKKALMNERLAPEILQYQGELIERVRERITQQEREIDRLERDANGMIAREAYGLERDRARWLVKAYLRTRLAKVQQFAAHVLAQQQVQARLSPQELKFANSYFAALGGLLHDTILSRLPANYSGLIKRFGADTSTSMIEEPDLDVFVFCAVDRDCGQIPDGPNGETAELNAGDVLNIRYQHVAHLVQGGQVHLI